ncbi:3-mercaptopyruvate sulfurtransferase [Agrobacterium larrymoorei]|uniref:3-mercaptopyruvate sulfurtransferase n=1 Tax=Agrobacterium larrymoorei TaxID=160699 RepID=A0A4D7DKL5_9HYPH|nr:3-mercaptopyruvate sulfurtransferase [Agrobacterium larrymoorei]QCI98123.1 3-mercaptopyruvate sulfurtransferase [Agrobacterium larrymoorei]QYA06424.1 3-mercaptopyruvate sulfurtransferase [Agrobacterium larrymoorei]
MSTDKSRFVVSADWVEQQLGTPHFRVVDASWYLPAHKRDGKQEYAAGHIPGAVFFDQDVIADHDTGLPHSLPSPEFFAEAVGQLGIEETDTIVVYDGPGFFSAPRVWWMLRVMGAEKVYVLDGGLDGWKAAGKPLETEAPQVEPATFHADFNARRVTSFSDMRAVVDAGQKQIADARGAGRFTGDEAEPRAGMRSGHMPGARNLPATAFSENGHFKDLPAIRKMIAEAGIDLSQPVVTSCGSGVTAAVITLALESLGHSDNSLYDGSWSEWGSKQETPVVTGPAEPLPVRPHGPLKAHVTQLEMTSAPKVSLPVPVNIQTAIMRTTNIPLHFYRYLYWRVGKRWHWQKRMRMSDAELSAVLHDPKNCVTVLYLNGSPAGFFEFNKGSDDVTELSYFGLMEEAIGAGVGKWFLLQALYSVWQDNPKKVTVSTNTLDHPRALQLYQMMGFSPVSTYEAWVEPLTDSEYLEISRRG